MFTTWRTSTIPRRVCANNELFISEVGMAWSTNRGTIKLHGNCYSNVHDNSDELVAIAMTCTCIHIIRRYAFTNL